MCVCSALSSGLNRFQATQLTDSCGPVVPQRSLAGSAQALIDDKRVVPCYAVPASGNALINVRADAVSLALLQRWRVARQKKAGGNLIMGVCLNPSNGIRVSHILGVVTFCGGYNCVRQSACNSNCCNRRSFVRLGWLAEHSALQT